MAQDRLNAWETLFRKALEIIDAAGQTVLRPKDSSFDECVALLRQAMQ